MVSNGNLLNGIDLTLGEAIDYFLGTAAKFNGYARNLAIGLGAVGLVWSGFQMMNSRLQVKQFFWGTIYKWVLFIILMTLYPAIFSSIPLMAAHYGTTGGLGEKVILTELSKLQDSLERGIEEIQKEGFKQRSELNEIFLNISKRYRDDIPHFDQYGMTYEEWLSKVDTYMESAFGSMPERMAKKGRKQYNKWVESVRRSEDYKVASENAETIEVLKQIMIEVKQGEGTEIEYNSGGNHVKKWVHLNLWLIDDDGKAHPYFSPNTLFNLALLSCEIIWKRVSTETITDDSEDSDTDNRSRKIGAIFHPLQTAEDIASHGANFILAVIMCISIVVCTIFVLLQYIMCVVEYCIITAIGSFYIPFILFDGTKEMPKKLIPVFTAFLIKLIVMNLCMIFVFYLYINFTANQISIPGNFSWHTVAIVMFTVALGFVLTSNAPKIAQTLLTGQPQLSMGEFVQAVGAMAGAGILANKAINTARSVKRGAQAMKHGVEQAYAGTVNGAANTIAGGIKMVSAAKGAANQIDPSNATGWNIFKAGASGAGAALTGMAKERVKAWNEKILHGETSSGRGGLGGSSGSVYARSGTTNNGVSINNNSNARLQDSYKVDDITGEKRNLSFGEFIKEKGLQGSDVGSQLGKNMNAKYEKYKREKWGNTGNIKV